MFKTIICAILILGTFAQKQNQRERLNYIDQLVLPSFAPTQSTGDLTVDLISYLPKYASSLSITVQLREISDVNNPLTSTSVTSQVCTITSNVCSIVFTAPALNSANKYTIRLIGSSGFHKVSIHAELAIKTAIGISNRRVKGEFFLSPKSAANTGFRFYVDTVGIWNSHFAIASSPAPIVTSYDFSLWSININNNLSEVQTLSLSASGTLSFTISTVGYYFLTVNLEISKIDFITRYPIVLDFEYGRSVCASGQFFNRYTKTCVVCSSDPNASGSSTERKCDCDLNFQWIESQMQCVACPVNGCQSKSSKYRGKSQPKVEHFGQNSQVSNDQYQGIRQNAFNHYNQNRDYGHQNYGQTDFNYKQPQSQARTQSTQQGNGAQTISQGFINGNLRNDPFGHN